MSASLADSAGRLLACHRTNSLLLAWGMGAAAGWQPDIRFSRADHP